MDRYEDILKQTIDHYCVQLIAGVTAKCEAHTTSEGQEQPPQLPQSSTIQIRSCEGINNDDVRQESDKQPQKIVEKKTKNKPLTKKEQQVSQLELQRKQILEQMNNLDDEFKKYQQKDQKVSNDKQNGTTVKNSPKKPATLLIQQLSAQRRQMEARRKREEQKRLREIDRQQQEMRKAKQQRQARRQAEKKEKILQRMNLENARKQERKRIQQQSKQLIAKLKYEQKLQKEANLALSQLEENSKFTKSRATKSQNKFHLETIEEHDQRYREQKKQILKEKLQKKKSAQKYLSENTHRYEKNIWLQKIEQDKRKKREQQEEQEQMKKQQLEKRLKYGELVKNIFLPKKKATAEIESNDKDTRLPKIKSNSLKSSHFEKSKTKTEETRPRNSPLKVKKERTQTQMEEDRLMKLKQKQLRKETALRLKKLENIDLNSSSVEKKRYQNYLGKVKIKKQKAPNLKDIVADENMTEQQRYRSLIDRAAKQEAKAKKKEDFTRKADEQAVNYYISSIEAKMALLERMS